MFLIEQLRGRSVMAVAGRRLPRISDGPKLLSGEGARQDHNVALDFSAWTPHSPISNTNRFLLSPRGTNPDKITRFEDGFASVDPYI
jgi:hypothetical protein